MRAVTLRRPLAAHWRVRGTPSPPRFLSRAALSTTTTRPSPPSSAPWDSAAPGPFVVLGIETSCDDTAVAVVRSDGVILGEAIQSQEEVHEKWGGVMPALARDTHAEVIGRVFLKALERAGIPPTLEGVDAVAVTTGPGLELCLRVGTTFAQDLAGRTGKPFVGVNHLEAHCLTPRLVDPGLTFPYVSLLVSGGHCQIVLCKDLGDYAVLGSTLDDAVGEAFDKAARMLGLPVGGGGGPALEALARHGDPHAFRFTVPMRRRKGCDYSYSGLKNNFRLAILRAVAEMDVDVSVSAGAGDGDGDADGDGDGDRDRDRDSSDASSASEDGSGRNYGIGSVLPDSVRADLAASFQHAALLHLEERLQRAMLTLPPLEPNSGGEERGEADVDVDVDEETNGTVTPMAAIATPTTTIPAASLVVCGGVASNQELRSRLQALCDYRGLPPALPPSPSHAQGGAGNDTSSSNVPKRREFDRPWRLVTTPIRLCTDNGVMVAWAAIEHLRRGFVAEDPHQPNIRARWPLHLLIPHT